MTTLPNTTSISALHPREHPGFAQSLGVPRYHKLGGKTFIEPELAQTLSLVSHNFTTPLLKQVHAVLRVSVELRLLVRSTNGMICGGWRRRKKSSRCLTMHVKRVKKQLHCGEVLYTVLTNILLYLFVTQKTLERPGILNFASIKSTTAVACDQTRRPEHMNSTTAVSTHSWLRCLFAPVRVMISARVRQRRESSKLRRRHFFFDNPLKSPLHASERKAASMRLFPTKVKAPTRAWIRK